MSEIISDVERSESDFTFVKKLLDKANYMSLSKYFREKEITSNEEKNKFKYANAWRIFQTVSMGSGTSSEIVESRRNLFISFITPVETVFITAMYHYRRAYLCLDIFVFSLRRGEGRDGRKTGRCTSCN